MDPFSHDAVRSAYDRVAADYVDAFGDDLAELPVDRGMLDEALARLPDRCRVLDLGCGPGSVGSYLADRSAVVAAADLSGEMLRLAAARDPRLGVVQTDMRTPACRSGSFHLVIAYYSLQHLRSADVDVALDEIGRVLVADGFLLLAAHLGEGDVIMDDFLGHRIQPMGGALYDREDLIGRVVTAGFDVDTLRERGHLDHEYPSRRLYLLAHRRPA